MSSPSSRYRNNGIKFFPGGSVCITYPDYTSGFNATSPDFPPYPLGFRPPFSWGIKDRLLYKSHDQDSPIALQNFHAGNRYWINTDNTKCVSWTYHTVFYNGDYITFAHDTQNEGDIIAACFNNDNNLVVLKLDWNGEEGTARRYFIVLNIYDGFSADLIYSRQLYVVNGSSISRVASHGVFSSDGKTAIFYFGYFMGIGDSSRNIIEFNNDYTAHVLIESSDYSSLPVIQDSDYYRNGLFQLKNDIYIIDKKRELIDDHYVFTLYLSVYNSDGLSDKSQLYSYTVQGTTLYIRREYLFKSASIDCYYEVTETGDNSSLPCSITLNGEVLLSGIRNAFINDPEAYYSHQYAFDGKLLIVCTPFGTSPEKGATFIFNTITDEIKIMDYRVTYHDNLEPTLSVTNSTTA